MLADLGGELLAILGFHLPDTCGTLPRNGDVGTEGTALLLPRRTTASDFLRSLQASQGIDLCSGNFVTCVWKRRLKFWPIAQRRFNRLFEGAGCKMRTCLSRLGLWLQVTKFQRKTDHVRRSIVSFDGVDWI